MNLVKQLIINTFFVFIATNILYYLLNKDKTKRIKMTIMLLAGLILNIMISIVIYKLEFNFYGTLQFIYEIICFGIILNTIYDNRKKLNFKICLDRKEKIIISISFISGLFYLLILAISNFRYIIPVNEFGGVGNVYFNADVHRGTNELLKYDLLVHMIHPLYRFINLPITLPIMVLNIIISKLQFSGLNILIMNGYLITIIQLILNSISSVVLYKILKQCKINDNLSIIGTLLFIFSMTFIWLSIIPETYSITLLTLLLMLYFYVKNSNAWILFAILTLGSNFMTILPIAIIVLNIFMKNVKRFSRKQKIILSLIIILLIITSIPVIMYSYKYINKWSDTNSLGEKLNNSAKVLIPIILGPEFININPFFVQVKDTNIVSISLFTVLLLIAIIGYIVNAKKSVLSNICIMQLIAGYILHVIVGYGINNGVIYVPLYTWAFIVLVVQGFEYMNGKSKRLTFLLSTALVSLVVIYNITWFLEFRECISEQKFTIPSKLQTMQVQLQYETGKEENFIIANKSIIQLRTGKKIISDMDDSYVYDKYSNTISGTLMNSKWFEIYTQGDKLKINICEDIEEIEDEEFFILGMGLREKYLFVKDTENNKYYKLIRYSDTKDILTNLILEHIDYENYTIYATNIKGEKVVINENEKGIYMSINGKNATLDDSIKINIPSFEDYKYKKQLRILLNEIMVNITKDGPKPNFIAYENPWYRDSSLVAMVLKETGNMPQIQEWIENIDKIYDMQNGYEEADNLGQVLYLMSLVDNKNIELIEDILEEAEKLKTEEGYIKGITDGSYHPVYQTKWLIYGLKSLNINYDNWKVPNLYDSYEPLIWFDKESEKLKLRVSDRWPYIMYAYLHYDNTNIDIGDMSYPISSEYSPSKANFEKLRIINNDFSDSKLVVPHSWSAAEMFLYLLDLG